MGWWQLFIVRRIVAGANRPPTRGGWQRWLASDRGEGALGGIQGRLQLSFAMGDRGEAGLIGAGCEIDPLLQHQMEETAEALRITGHDILEGLDGVGTAEVKAEHGTDLSGDEGHAGRIG